MIKYGLVIKQIKQVKKNTYKLIKFDVEILLLVDLKL